MRSERRDVREGVAHQGPSRQTGVSRTRLPRHPPVPASTEPERRCQNASELEVNRMSVNLSIKNAPDEVVKKLKGRAARHHRSLQGELMAIIEAAVQQDEEPLTPREALAGCVGPGSQRRPIRCESSARAARAAMSVVVVDASAMAALLFGEPAAEEVMERLDGSNLAAPSLLPMKSRTSPAAKCGGARLGRRSSRAWRSSRACASSFTSRTRLPSSVSPSGAGSPRTTPLTSGWRGPCRVTW